MVDKLAYRGFRAFNSRKLRTILQICLQARIVAFLLCRRGSFIFVARLPEAEGSSFFFSFYSVRMVSETVGIVGIDGFFRRYVHVFSRRRRKVTRAELIALETLVNFHFRLVAYIILYARSYSFSSSYREIYLALIYFISHNVPFSESNVIKVSL